jgi:antitoxin MazE
VLEQSGLADEVELDVEEGRIVLRAPENPRAGWEEAFVEMNARGDDVLLDGDQPGSSSWDDEEWVWD